MRRKWLLLILLSSSAVCVADDWPCFQHDVRHTGCTPHELRLPLEMIWEKKIGWSTSQAIAVDGKLYLGRWKGDLISMDQRTGEILWSYQTGDQISFSACVADGKVFIGSNDHHIYCLSTTGELVWRRKTEGQIWSSPIVAEGLVFCGSKDGNLWLIRINLQHNSGRKCHA